MRLSIKIFTYAVGGPEKISNGFILLQTSLTEAEFDADSENDLYFEVRGRTSEHKNFFRIEAPMRRSDFFRA